MNLLLTGPPRVGKSTALAAVRRALAPGHAQGFVTLEIRERGRRVGFRIETLGGHQALLAHVDQPGLPRVGRYAVLPSALEALLPRALVPGAAALSLIDEIGPMACLCPAFSGAVSALLDHPAPVVATVALRGSGLIAAVKARADVELWTVSPANRQRLPQRVLAWLADQGVG